MFGSHVARRISSQDVILIPADLFLKHGIPKHIRSDNGPEFIAKKLVAWIKRLEVQPLFIQPWKSMGKRLLRIIQRQDAIRISGWRNFLFPLGSKDFNRTLEDSLQHEKTAQQFGWKTASPTNFSANTQTTCAGFINTVGGSKTPSRSDRSVTLELQQHQSTFEPRNENAGSICQGTRNYASKLTPPDSDYLTQRIWGEPPTRQTIAMYSAGRVSTPP
jgi:hypothetical protein